MPCVLAHQLAGMAVNAIGEFGAPFSGVHLAALVPQLLLAVTHNWPVVNEPYCTLTELLPLPITVPGAVQLYVTPGDDGTV